MTTRLAFFTKHQTIKYALLLVFALTLSACSMTKHQQESQVVAVNENQSSQYETDSESNCQNHAMNIAKHAESTASTAQYSAAANAMNSCINAALQKRAYNNNQTQQENIMQMMAVATLNFIKAGHVLSATREVERFKRIYPNQDLYFDDYTSFIDTATALLSIEPLGASQISSLNISRVLRDEMERKHYWLNH